MSVKSVTLTYICSVNLVQVSELLLQLARSRDWNERDWTLRHCAMLVLHDVLPRQTGHSAKRDQVTSRIVVVPTGRRPCCIRQIFFPLSALILSKVSFRRHSGKL